MGIFSLLRYLALLATIIITIHFASLYFQDYTLLAANIAKSKSISINEANHLVFVVRLSVVLICGYVGVEFLVGRVFFGFNFTSLFLLLVGNLETIHRMDIPKFISAAICIAMAISIILIHIKFICGSLKPIKQE